MQNKFYQINNIESRFKEITDITYDLSIYPILTPSPFKIRTDLKNSHGEVFTPLDLVDKMLEISKPNPNKFNLDLCSGRGQFTIRMLRKFHNENNNFNIEYYLENLHWFNELNEDSANDLQYIFGNKINLAIGPAQELKHYPVDVNNIWVTGIVKWNGKHWETNDDKKLIENFFDIH